MPGLHEFGFETFPDADIKVGSVAGVTGPIAELVEPIVGGRNLASEHVNAQGQSLRPGDILSLGTMGSPRPVEAGRTITVRYTGLPTGQSEASIAFR